MTADMMEIEHRFDHRLDYRLDHTYCRLFKEYQPGESTEVRPAGTTNNVPDLQTISATSDSGAATSSTAKKRPKNSNKKAPVKAKKAKEEHKENHELPSGSASSSKEKVASPSKKKPAQSKKKKSDSAAHTQPNDEVHQLPVKTLADADLATEPKKNNPDSVGASPSLKPTKEKVSKSSSAPKKGPATKKPGGKKAKKGPVMKIRVQGIAFGKRRRSSAPSSAASTPQPSNSGSDKIDEYPAPPKASRSSTRSSPQKKTVAESPPKKRGRPPSSKGTSSKKSKTGEKVTPTLKKGRGRGKNAPGAKRGRPRLVKPCDDSTAVGSDNPVDSNPSTVVLPVTEMDTGPQVTTKSGRIVKRKLGADKSPLGFKEKSRGRGKAAKSVSVTSPIPDETSPSIPVQGGNADSSDSKNSPNKSKAKPESSEESDPVSSAT